MNDLLNRHVSETRSAYRFCTEVGPQDRWGVKELLGTMMTVSHWSQTVICPNIYLQTFPISLRLVTPTVLDYTTTKIRVELPYPNEFGRPTAPVIREFLSEDMRGLMHSYVFEPFGRDQDMQLQRYILRLQDHDDISTPDLIMWPDNRTCFVLEFATSMSNSITTNKLTMNQKIAKYKQSLVNRGNKIVEAIGTSGRRLRIIYCVVVVCSEYTLSNFKVPVSLSKNLVSRMITAKAIRAAAMDRGLVIPEVSDMAYVRAVNSILETTVEKFDPDDVNRGMSRRLFHNLDCTKPMLDMSLDLYKKAHTMAGMEAQIEMNKTHQDRMNEKKAVIKKYKEDTEGVRTDSKSIIHFPWIFMSEKQSCPIPPLVDLDFKRHNAHYMHALWSRAFMADHLGEIKGDTLTLDALEEEASNPIPQEVKDERKKNRMKYRRVRLELDAMEKIELAKLGIGKKKLQDDGRVQDYLADKKECFSWSVDTSDIDSFMSHAASLESTVPVNRPQYLENTIRLIDRSLDFHPSTEQDWKVANKFLCSKMFNIATWWSHVGVELTVALQQNCREGTFIFKKLKNYPVCVLIKPTHANGPIFYSLAFTDLTNFEHYDNTCFKKLFNFGNFYCTEFSSYNRSKLINLVRLPMLLLALYPEWMAYDNLNILEDEPSSEVWKMMALSLLVITEDKAHTEEVFTQFRYLFMEKFVPNFSCPNPTKVTERLPSLYRSRLAIWASKCLLHCATEPQYHSTTEEGRGSWFGMINPYTGSRITDPQVLLTLSYIGYLKFKSEKSEANSDMQLIEKMVDSQKSMLESDPRYFGKEDRPDLNYGFGEFSRTQVLASAEMFKKVARTKYGDEWQTIIDKDIKHELGRQTWDDYATLKASSVYNPTESMTTIDTKKVITKRAKCISVVMQKYPELPETPLEYVPQCLEACEKAGGIQADVFKKNQHGGTREIMVLNMESKILQKTIEIISRKLCEVFQFETLTHPRNKIRLPQEHSLKMNVIKKSKKTFNLSSSCDAKNWNHCHHVNKFAILLCAILPKSYHNLVVRILRLWRTKMIKYPDGLMNLLIEKPATELHSESYTLIRESWTGAIRTDWLPVRANFMRIEAGMLQGILHYTSSLMHACFLKLRDENFKHFFSSTDLKASALTLDLVSSDDSARVIDVIVGEDDDLTAAAAFSSLDASCMKYYSKTMGIIMSNKSTLNLTNILEFNSEFMLGPNLYRPRIKWIEAAINITECEGFVDRQQIMATMLTELLEGGAPSMMVHIVQVAQAMLHYLALGNTMGGLFDRYSLRLNLLPDPSLGFFVMDHPYAAGYLGFKYNYWNLLKQCKMTERQMSFYLQDVEMTITSSGVISRVVLMKFGNRIIWLGILRIIELMHPQWRDLIANDPSILYNVTSDKIAVGLRIMVKLTSPSVALSLSSGTSLARVISSAVYAIGQETMSLNNAWISSPNFVVGDDKKSSLMRLVKEQHSTHVDLSPAQWETLFPASEEYENTRNMLAGYSRSGYIVGAKTRRLRSTVLVFSGVDQENATLFSVCRWKWFGVAFPSSRQQREDLWLRYKQCFPWLADTEAETLRLSPFDTSIQLSNFVGSELKTRRQVRLTAAPIQSVYSHDHLKEAIEENLWVRVKLTPGVSGLLTNTGKVVKSLSTHLALLGNLELPEQVVKENVKLIFSSHELNWTRTLLSTNKKLRTLTAFKQFFRKLEANELEVITIDQQTYYVGDSLIDDFLAAKSGVVGGFVMRQTPLLSLSGIKWVGKGLWVGEINGVKLRIRLFDDIMVEIETNDAAGMVLELGTFLRLVKEMGWTHSNASQGDATYIFTNNVLSRNLETLGTPVILVSTIQSNIMESRMPMNFEYLKGNLRLYTYNEETDKKVTLLNYKTVDSDRVRPDDCFEVPYEIDLIVDWFEGEPIETRKFRTCIRVVAEDTLTQAITNSWKKIAQQILLHNFSEIRLSNPDLVGMPEGIDLSDLDDEATAGDVLREMEEALDILVEAQASGVDLLRGHLTIDTAMSEAVRSGLEEEGGGGYDHGFFDAYSSGFGELTELCRRFDIFSMMSMPSTLKLSAMGSRILEDYINSFRRKLSNIQQRHVWNFVSSPSDRMSRTFRAFSNDFSYIFGKVILQVGEEGEESDDPDLIEGE